MRVIQKIENQAFHLTLLFAAISLLSLNTCNLRKTSKKANSSSYAKGALKILENTHTGLNSTAISAAVGIDNKIVWANVLGFKDLENRVPADLETKFRIGSTSKALTSVAIGRLIQEDRLDLDASVQVYLKDFDKSKPKITIRQLASHSSGIRNYKGNEYENNTQYNSIKESMEVFLNDTLLFKPGTKFNYSTYNYTVLSAVIEYISQQNFLDHMKKRVFMPLKMNNTTGDYNNKLVENRAKFYVWKTAEKRFAITEVNNSYKWAGGGFISTPSDMVKFGNALLNNKLINPAVTKRLFQPQQLSDGKINSMKYGIGWRNDSTSLFNGRIKTQLIHHPGSSIGATSIFLLLPEYNMTISILSNRDGAYADLTKCAYLLAEYFIESRVVK